MVVAFLSLFNFPLFFFFSFMSSYLGNRPFFSFHLFISCYIQVQEKINTFFSIVFVPSKFCPPVCVRIWCFSVFLFVEMSSFFVFVAGGLRSVTAKSSAGDLQRRYRVVLSTITFETTTAIPSAPGDYSDQILFYTMCSTILHTAFGFESILLRYASVVLNFVVSNFEF
jgi:hypothetical protein